MTAGIRDFYINTPMEWLEYYMAIPIADLLETIIMQYNLHELKHNGNVYIEIQKGMYGLPQAECITDDKLSPILEKSRIPPSQSYTQSVHT